MSDGSTADPGGLYAPMVNLSALEASPFKTSDGTITHGSDPAASAPEKPYGLGTAFGDVYDTFFGKGPLVETPKAAEVRKAAETKATGGFTITQTLVWSAVLVVVGILMLSRGFGVLTEEGENVFVNLSDPKKYPGIGHAIRGVKSGGKAAALAAE